MKSLRKFLFENEAVKGIKTPMDFLYLKLISAVLRIISTWPERELGENTSKKKIMFLYCFNVFLTIAGFTLGVTYLVTHSATLTFYEMGHMYITVFMTMTIAVRLLSLSLSSSYRKVATTFITRFHLFHFKNQSDYAMQVHKKVHLISHLFTIVISIQLIGVTLLFNLIPMYSNFALGNFVPGGLQNSTYEYAVYFSYPFNSATDFHGYIAACSLGWLVSCLCSVWFCVIDLLLSLMVFHAWGHFKILLDKLYKFPRPSSLSTGNDNWMNNEMFSETESVNVDIMLKECIRHHHFIANFTNAMSDAFGTMLFAYYVFHQISGCLLLLECSQMTTQALVRYVPLTIVLFQQLIQLSVVFELIGTVSEKLHDGVYGLPWEYIGSKNRKTVLIFLMNVQSPIHVKALGVSDVGVRSMATILKTSFSYFTFLRTFS